MQHVAHEIISSGFIQEHVRELRKVYSSRRNAMLDALTEFMPEETYWSHPEGGMFLWVRCNKKIKTAPFMEKAVKGKGCLRAGLCLLSRRRWRFQAPCVLNFSYSDEPTIVEGRPAGWGRR